MASFNAGYGGAQRQRSLAGATPTGENNSNKFPIGTELWDDSTLLLGGQKLWRVQFNTAGTAKVWVQLTGAGASGAGWPNYVVSADADVPAPYATIPTAIAAAVTNLHGAANPATVLVHPGTYSDVLAITVPGIAIMGFGPTGSAVATAGAVIVSGATTIAPAATGQFLFENLTIAAAAAMTVSAGSGTASVLLRNCVVQVTGANAITWTNPAGTLQVFDSRISSSNAQWLSAGTVAMDLVAYNSQLLGLVTGTGATLNDSASSGQTLSNCTIFGGVSLPATLGSPGGVRIFSDCIMVTSGIANPAFTTSATPGAVATILGGVVDSGSTGATFGTGTDVGTFTLTAVRFGTTTLGNSVVGVALAANRAVYQRPTRVLIDNVAQAILASDRNLVIPAQAANTTLTLPDIRTFPDGESLEFVKLPDAGSEDTIIQVVGGAPGVAGSVNGLTRITLTDPTSSACILRADRTNAMWLIVSASGTFTNT